MPHHGVGVRSSRPHPQFFGRTRGLFTGALVAIVSLVVLSACGDDGDPAATAGPEPVVVEPAMSGFTARLDDRVETLGDGRVAWSTTWTLCWPEHSGATGYEIDTVTGEGSVRDLEERSGNARCLEIEAAAGENAPELGMADRALLLSTTAGQLGYQVRAVLDDDQVSTWSPLFPVGEA